MCDGWPAGPAPSRFYSTPIGTDPDPYFPLDSLGARLTLRLHDDACGAVGRGRLIRCSPQLGQCVRRQCCAFRRLQCLQLPGRSSQVRAEASNPEPGKIGLHSVHEARGLLHKVLALSARSPCVLVCDCGDRSHAAVLWFTAQPAEKSALEELGIETIGLRPSMFARYRNARRVDHIGLDLTGAQPARQPEAVAASLIGHSDPLDDLAGLIGFLLPTMQKLQQSMLIGRELFQRLAFDSRHDTGDQPT